MIYEAEWFITTFGLVLLNLVLMYRTKLAETEKTGKIRDRMMSAFTVLGFWYIWVIHNFYSVIVSFQLPDKIPPGRVLTFFLGIFGPVFMVLQYWNPAISNSPTNIVQDSKISEKDKKSIAGNGKELK